MKKKTTLTLLIACFTTVYMVAQCRLVRAESMDSLKKFYYNYDKLGRFTSFLDVETEAGVTTKYEIQYAYNAAGKIVQRQTFSDDTLLSVWSVTYKKDWVDQSIYTNVKTGSSTIGSFFYDENKQQLTHFRAKTSNGDTIFSRFEYAPEGWLKRHTQLSNDTLLNFVVELTWDSNAKSIDPERAIMYGQILNFLAPNHVPNESPSVKGMFKGRSFYKMDKNGQRALIYSDELFDFKTNASGYLYENKYKNSFDNKVVVFRSFFEGCKN